MSKKIHKEKIIVIGTIGGGAPKRNISHLMNQIDNKHTVQKSIKVYDRKKEKNKLKKDLTLY
jgi:hypothetical protein